MRLLKWSAITYAAALPFANGLWFISHFWFPCQLTRFFLGMVVGDAVLHVEMDEPTERLCGRVTSLSCATGATTPSPRLCVKDGSSASSRSTGALP